MNRIATAPSKISMKSAATSHKHLPAFARRTRRIAPSQDAANKVWDQVKLANPNLDDITLDLQVNQTQAQGAVATGGQSAQSGQTYTVKSGDTLSKISRQFYGDANKYHQIFEANRPMLKDPNEIYPGQKLRIPAEAAVGAHA